MDRILTKLDELTALQNKVIQLEATVDSLSSAVVVLNQEVAYLKEKENHRDQQERGNSARLFGLCIGLEEEDPMALAKRVYDTVVRPVLVAAKANKHIEAVPNLSNALKEVYRARGSTKLLIVGQPPPPSPSDYREVFFLHHQEGLLHEQEGQYADPLPPGGGCWHQEIHRRGGPDGGLLQEAPGDERLRGHRQSLVR